MAENRPLAAVACGRGRHGGQRAPLGPQHDFRHSAATLVEIAQRGSTGCKRPLFKPIKRSELSRCQCRDGLAEIGHGIGIRADERHLPQGETPDIQSAVASLQTGMHDDAARPHQTRGGSARCIRPDCIDHKIGAGWLGIIGRAQSIDFERTGGFNRSMPRHVRFRDVYDIAPNIRRHKSRGKADRPAADDYTPRRRQRPMQRAHREDNGIIRHCDRLGERSLHDRHARRDRHDIALGNSDELRERASRGGMEMIWRAAHTFERPETHAPHRPQATSGLIVTRSPLRGPVTDAAGSLMSEDEAAPARSSCPC